MKLDPLFTLTVTLSLLALGPVSGAPENASPTSHSSPSGQINMTQQHLDAAIIHRSYVERDFQDVQQRAEHLSNRKPPALPEHLLPGYQTMRQQASKVSESGSVTEMANAIVTLASSCSDCHRTVNARPRTQPIFLESDESRRGHAVASSLMWQGLLFSDAVAWRKGTEVLRQDVAMINNPDSPILKLLETQVDEIALQGHAEPVSWRSHYGKYLELCIACHALSETQ